MSDEALKKLASVFARQQKILEKLAEMTSIEEFEESPPTVREVPVPRNQEIELSHLEDIEGDLPPDFDAKLSHYQKMLQQRDPELRRHNLRTIREMLGVAHGEPEAVKEFGKYFKGWKPEHFQALLKMLRV